MLRNGIINAELAQTLAALRHTDRLVVADSGLPVPAGAPRLIDLAVVYGVPPFATVLRAVVSAIVVEGATVAEEIADTNPSALAAIERAVDVPLERVAHVELKRRTMDAVAVIRTGEATPYANVILQCGVPFA
jgi:D-ribose pyranase